MATDKSKSLPKLILVFMMVDRPIFMRWKMIEALADAAVPYGTTVVAINRPLCPFSTLFNKPDRVRELFGKPRLQQLKNNLYLFSPRYFIHDSVAAGSHMLEQLNITALRKSYVHLCHRIGVREEKPLIWFYHPRQGYATDLFTDSFNIFEIKDNFADLDGNELEPAKAQEESLRNRIDLLLCASKKLLDKYSGGYRKAWLSGNGLDRNTYDRLVGNRPQSIPELTSIPGPRIGYTGLISRRLDWNLILEIARRQPEWSFVFVGKVSDPSIRPLTASFSNIHFPGWYDHEQMPEVLSSFNIGFMPYRDNNFFRYSNPLKFYEFAAAGLRMVSSNMEELKRFPEELVKIVPNSAGEWINALRGFLDNDSERARQIGAEVARKFIWEDMAAELLKKLENEV
jgi:glycosyltransferase involved in cell wall biosynthesis